MKVLINCLIFICIISFCKAQGVIQLTDTNYVVISYKQADIYKTSRKIKEASLSANEVHQIGDLANKCIDEYNKGKWEKIDKNYKIQLVPFVNEKGEKEVWVNCFCWYDGDWRKNIAGMMDGGSCFFNLKINLNRKKYYHLIVNGYA